MESTMFQTFAESKTIPKPGQKVVFATKPALSSMLTSDPLVLNRRSTGEGVAVKADDESQGGVWIVRHRDGTPAKYGLDEMGEAS